MSKAKQTKSPNADLVTAARAHRDQILRFHDQRRRRQRLSSCSTFSDCGSTPIPSRNTRPRSARNRKRCSTRNTRRPWRRNKVLVVVWDSETRRLATTRIRRSETHSGSLPCHLARVTRIQKGVGGCRAALVLATDADRLPLIGFRQEPRHETTRSHFPR